MARIASNEKFNSSIKLILITLSITVVRLIIYYKMNNYINETLKINLELPTEIISLNSLFNNKYKFITIIIVLYLLFTIITISFIVNISEGPLRINKK